MAGTADRLREAIASLCSVQLRRASDDEVDARVDEFARMSGYEAMGVKLLPQHTWYRGRKPGEGRDREDSLFGVIYPQAPPTDYGRLNRPGQRVLYAGWNVPTVLSELRPAEGTALQFVACRPQPGTEVLATVIGAYQFFHQSGQLFYPSQSVEAQLIDFFQQADPEQKTARLLADAFLAEVFRRRYRGTYRLTSAIAKRVFGSDRASGLLYPSVRNVAGVNLAVPDWVFDRHFEVMATEVCVVDRNHGFGVYDLRSTCSTRSFASNGDIDWDPRILLKSPASSAKSGIAYPVDAPSWRVPQERHSPRP